MVNAVSGIPANRRVKEQLGSQLHGSMYQATAFNTLYYGYSQAKTVTSANTTATGLIIHNPANSGVNLSINKIYIGVSVTSASLTGIALAQNVQATVPTGTTVATANGNAFIGAAAGKAVAYSAATLANAPTPILPLMHNSAAIATTGEDSIVVDLQGSIVIPPGYAVSLSALGAASAASAVTATILYEEIVV